MNDRSISRKRKLLEEASEAVAGDRQLNYGAPEQNFQRIAELWTTWFRITASRRGHLPSDHLGIEPWEVAALMVLMKLARLANTPTHHDSWVDIAGYAACGVDITEAKNE